jgi:hypothetical protein
MGENKEIPWLPIVAVNQHPAFAIRTFNTKLLALLSWIPVAKPASNSSI